ncbi:cytidyltransferase [Vibrio rotiferianus]|uniref:cytidylyltransferase domain-containing protein n=1 Tax=Vibrio rotiferianus TaxID=190895 RepID=UPI001110A2DF|nr:cytidyltransferase [Vibrio rotiferianus]TMX44376.1 cytidyltransferase [Vibrio rotiferianus]TMX48771.1 cytidyltransferase [Vibrio rotiferianus]TMX61997.1 cytidyltransferase [Vibrio rotiferianus]
MKVVAIIPARAGSKGIPNKNIRLLNGKPLICYAIENAIQCALIDKVVVTTDSKEVEIIATRMGASVIKRDEQLCKDDITLDSVIFDAVRKLNENFDVVVTMQPTSPTLKSDTLNNALHYYKSSEVDTIISAINKPHLSWVINEVGEKEPDYKKRLNRQYLPPRYLETGAFVISNRQLVNETSRISGKIEIFELSEDESIDIDSYTDLKLCEEILSRKKVAFYVNGNTKRGLGHIYRCLELADEFYIKPDIYYDKNQTKLELFGESTHNFIGVDGIGELFNILENEKYDLFINDILNTTVDYMVALKKCNPAKKIVNFEDDGEGVIYSDLVINALYENPSVEQMKAGEKYYICPKTFLFYEPINIKDKVRDIFISFGGADPKNYTDRLIEIIKKEKYREFNFTVVIGRAKQNVESLLKESTNNVEVLYDVRNMPELMSKSDIAITSRGRTGYELALLGVPCIAMAQNEREEKHGFVSVENGFIYLGLNPSDKIIESNLDALISLSRIERTEIQSKLREHDLRNGRSRVINMINNL